MLHWLYPGQHPSAAVAYSRELAASVRAKYGLILLAFPVIGLILGWASGASAASEPGAPPSAPPGGSGARRARLGTQRRIRPAASGWST